MSAAPVRAWPRRPEVQGLRAVAVVAVVAFHAGLPLPGGFLGVDAFFVVSGWALTGLLLVELRGTGTIGVGSFLARRARRLLPLLALVVGVTMVVHVLTSNPWAGEPVVPRTGLAGLAISANAYLYRHTGYFGSASDALNPFLHLWSLSTEEQIYLVLPLLLLVGWRAARRPRGAIVVLLVAGAASAILAWALATGAWSPLEAPERFAFYSPLTRLWEVAVGGLVAAWALTRPPPGRRVAAVGAGVAAAVLLGSFVLVDAGAALPVPGAVATVLATAALLALAPVGGAVARTLASGPMTWIGDRSYGWYLWHWPAIVVADRIAPGQRPAALVAAAGSLGLAALTHGAVEERFRHDRTLVGRRALATSVAVLAVPASLAVLAGTGVVHGWGLEEPGAWADTALRSREGCVIVNRDLPDALPPSCHDPGPGGGTILVLGDAVANVEPAAEAAGAALGLGTTVWGRAGCPYTGRPAVGYERCAGWLDEAAALVRRSDPAAVVVANASTDHVVAGTTPGDPVQGHGVEGDGSRVARWEAALDLLLDELSGDGVPVVVVGPVPSYGREFPRERLWPLRPHPAVPDRPVAEVDAERATTVAAERRAVAAHDRTAYLDPVPVLCATTCRPERDGTWTHSDAALLTVPGSVALAGDLEVALVRAGVAP